VEVKKGGKISPTLGHLVIICNFVQQLIFILLFLTSVQIQNVNFLEIYIENIKYLFHKRVLLLFSQFLSVEAEILHRVAPYI
jgi:hypothetical protein